MVTCNTLQNSRTLRLGLALGLGLASLIGLLLAMSAVRPPQAALAQSPRILYVAPAPPGNDTGNDCMDSGAPCATLQHAVDVANPGDEVRVATGVYTDVHVRPRNDVETSGVVTQVVYISKTVTVRGGYTTAFADPPDPVANLTTLDARGQGRVLYITGAISPTIEGLDLTGGDATGLGGLASGWDAGGGVYVISATVTMNNNQVSDNFARFGGGLHFQDSPDLTLTGNTISNNRAGPELGGGGTGGGVYFIGCSEPELTNNTISENGATEGGGLTLVNSPGAMLSNNTVSNNVADHLGGGVKHYAGVYFDHSDDATLIGNTISGNRSANRCGGVCFSDSDNVTLERNTVISNSAGSPGFVVSEGGGLYFASSANADLSGNTISQNSTNTFGGGIYVAVSTISLTGNRINSNQSTQGAGLYLTGGDATLDRNLITGNVSSSYPAYGLDGDGGGLCLNNAEATLTSNVIIDNQVEVEGSGLYITGSSADLLHTTIARNSGGDDSGVHIAGIASIVSLTNTIVATHQVGIFAAAGNTANINGVLWYNNDTGYGGGGTFSVTNEYTGDPAFKRDGYHLTRSSAAIDRGVDGGVTMDIDGFGRPCGLAPDLGADEMPCLFLPVILRNWGG